MASVMSHLRLNWQTMLEFQWYFFVSFYFTTTLYKCMHTHCDNGKCSILPCTKAASKVLNEGQGCYFNSRGRTRDSFICRTSLTATESSMKFQRIHFWCIPWHLNVHQCTLKCIIVAFLKEQATFINVSIALMCLNLLYTSNRLWQWINPHIMNTSLARSSSQHPWG